MISSWAFFTQFVYCIHPHSSSKIYPALRRAGINFTALKKITLGFFLGAAAMVWAAVTQFYVYKTSPCGELASECDGKVSPLNVWIQAGAWVMTDRPTFKKKKMSNVFTCFLDMSSLLSVKSWLLLPGLNTLIPKARRTWNLWLWVSSSLPLPLHPLWVKPSSVRLFFVIELTTS